MNVYIWLYYFFAKRWNGYRKTISWKLGSTLQFSVTRGRKCPSGQDKKKVHKARNINRKNEVIFSLYFFGIVWFDFLTYSSFPNKRAYARSCSKGNSALCTSLLGTMHAPYQLSFGAKRRSDFCLFSIFFF